MSVPTVSGVVDFDVDMLAKFLNNAFGSDNGQLEIERIGGGQSNPTYFVNYGGEHHVLRKQPNGHILKGAHAIDRKYCVLHALYPTVVPANSRVGAAVI